MKIELKKIYFSERMSQETNCFAAEVYVDGKVLLKVENDGHGGSTDYHIHPSLHKNDGLLKEAREKLTKLEAYCKSLPPVIYHKSESPMNLEFKIDILLDDWLKAKDQVKIQKAIAKNMLKGIVSGTDERFVTTTWGKHTIAELLARPDGYALLKKKCEELRAKGTPILNTNLPKELLG